MLAVAPQAVASGSATSAKPSGQQYIYPYPLTVSISGPGMVYHDDPATWTALASYGTTPYTYTWYRNGVQVGTGSTYSTIVKSSFTLQVTVRDAVGATASASKSVAMEYECLHC